MKKMHKIGAGILAASLMMTAMALPAMAENADSTATVASMVTARGGRPGGQMPWGNNQQGQMPSNGNNQQGQMPGSGNNQQGQMPGNGNNHQGQMPGNGSNRHGQMRGKMGHRHGHAPGYVNFKELVEKGIIDEETLTKIEEYLKENAPAKPQMPADGQTAKDVQTPPEKPEGDQENTDDQTPPEIPEGDQADTDTQTQATPEKPEGDPAPTQGELPEGNNLIANLVEAGILTQEQAEAIESLTKTVAETETAAGENT